MSLYPKGCRTGSCEVHCGDPACREMNLEAYLTEQEPVGETVTNDGCAYVYKKYQNLPVRTVLFTAPWARETPVGAAPLPEEVRDLVERLHEEMQYLPMGASRYLQAARLLERLSAKNATLTQDRDELRRTLTWTPTQETLEKKLVASQAQEVKLRKALEYVAPMYPDVDIVQDALALPTDTSALDARLKDEREKCAKIAETAAHKLGGSQFAADAIRSMTGETN